MEIPDPSKTRDDFWEYFQLADELWDEGTPEQEAIKLTDFDPEWVEEVRAIAEKYGYPWLPDLPWAEEYYLDHYKELTKNGEER